MLYYPEADDLLTGFRAETWVRAAPVGPEDLDVLDVEFEATLAEHPAYVMESRDKRVIGKTLVLDYQYVFRDGDTVRQRWVRVFCLGHQETVMTAQGSSLEKYDYWLPWFYEAMATARVHFRKPTIASLG